LCTGIGLQYSHFFDWSEVALFYFRSDPSRSFETLDAAIEAAEIDDLTVAIVGSVDDVLVKRWQGGRLEYPVGAFSAEESASLSLLRHRVA
jgi:hypothetical protein